MKQQINVYLKRILLSVVILSLLALNSCKVTFLPSYDAKIAEQIENSMAQKAANAAMEVVGKAVTTAIATVL